MQQIFPPSHGARAYPAVVFPEVYTALQLRGRMGRDSNGRVLLGEQHETLDRAGVSDESVRELWLELWAAADEESEIVRAEEHERIAARGRGE